MKAADDEAGAVQRRGVIGGAANDAAPYCGRASTPASRRDDQRYQAAAALTGWTWSKVFRLIGRHGSPWTAETARAEAKRLLGMVEGGADPAADGIARKEAPTIAGLAERFLAEQVEAKRKASTALEYRGLLDRVILRVLGRRKAMDVIRHDIAKPHRGLRETPYQANRLLAVLSKMFNLAERWGLGPDGSNPCRHVEKFGERKRERMLSPAELARLGDALAAYDRSARSSSLFTGAPSAKCQGCDGSGLISTAASRSMS